jgi:hypothetical protein
VLPLKTGDVFQVTLGVGYSQAVEDLGTDPPVFAGTRYYLVLKYDPANHVYSQVGGASSARKVEEFREDDIAAFRAIHELAATPIPDRFGLARRKLVDPKSNFEVRQTCKRVLLGVINADVPERTQTISLLRDLWASATIQQDYYDIRGLDDTLSAIDAEFKRDSDVRVNGWLRLIFTPFARVDDATNSAAITVRWNSYLSSLSDLGVESPDRVAPKIMREMKDTSWPMQFRVGIAGCLMRIYQEADHPDPLWETELQQFYPRAFAAADGWVLRLLPYAITRGEEEPKDSIKRRFVSSEETWAAMQAALARMDAVAKANPRDPNALSAVNTLKEAISKRRR